MNFVYQNSTLIFVALGVVVLLLGGYLGFLWSQIQNQKKLNKRKQEELQQKLDEQKKYVVDSLDIIALATLQGQCDLSECCIRVKNLIDYFPDQAQKNNFLVFQQMYEEIKKFPTHEARNKQSKQETFNQDKERFRIEDKYRDRMLKSLELLRNDLASF